MMKNSVFLFFCFLFVCLSSSVEGELRGRFIHLTDTHILNEYMVGGDPKQYCVQGKGTGDAGEFGDYHCDPPPTLQNFTKESLKKREKPDFILYGGDHAAYFDQKKSLDETLVVIKNIAQDLREIQAAYGTDVRVFPMLGNHDSYPDFQMPEKGPFYVYETAAETWKDFLSPESQKTVRMGGYYTELIAPGLRLVVVNTAMYFMGNFVFPQTLVDPGGQLAWMRSVLQHAKETGEYVFLAAHIPPGSTFTVCIFILFLCCFYRLFHFCLLTNID